MLSIKEEKPPYSRVYVNIVSFMPKELISSVSNIEEWLLRDKSTLKSPKMTVKICRFKLMSRQLFKALRNKLNSVNLLCGGLYIAKMKYF